RGLGRRRRSHSPRALELPQPGSAATGTWNKEALAANGSGAAPEATNQRAPHAPSRPERGASK
ncbi:hypothetical protein HispidOSU_003556, partial [Sigmodon hispidus]